jgi:hypothetical protein
VAKKSKRQNKDKIARQETELRKFRLVWEAIRRREDYKQLYKNFCKTNIKNYDLYTYYISKCYNEFGVSHPIAPHIVSKKISNHKLKKTFRGHAVFINWDDFVRIYMAGRDFLKYNLQVDIKKPLAQIIQEFREFIQNLQKYKKKTIKRRTLKKRPRERQRIHDYCLEDFDIYDKVVKSRVDRKISFIVIARKRLQDRGDADISSYDADLEAKKLKSAYERAKWLIEGGYRTLV